MRRVLVALSLAALFSSPAYSQTPDLSGALRWRTIGPYRAGRARALAGVSGKPTVFYIGFDNRGLWGSSDYRSKRAPLVDLGATGPPCGLAEAPVHPRLHPGRDAAGDPPADARHPFA